MCTLNFDKRFAFSWTNVVIVVVVFFIMRNLINITYITSTRKIINISHKMNYDQLRLQSIYLFIECSPVQNSNMIIAFAKKKICLFKSRVDRYYDLIDFNQLIQIQTKNKTMNSHLCMEIEFHIPNSPFLCPTYTTSIQSNRKQIQIQEIVKVTD